MKCKIKFKAILTAVVLTVTLTIPSIEMQAISKGSTVSETISVEYFYTDGIIETDTISVERENDPTEYTPTRFEDFPNVAGAVDLTAEYTATNESIIITIMGDGFTANQQDDFIVEARKVKEQILAIYPYSEFKGQIKVFAIKTVSRDSTKGVNVKDENGYYDSTGKIPIYKTFFGSTIQLTSSGRTMVRFNGAGEYEGLKAAKKLRESFFMSYRLNNEYDKLSVILHNNTQDNCGAAVYKKDGAYDGFTVCAIDSINTGDVATHELAHSFGNLRDEYSPPSMKEESANLTMVSDPEKVRWKHFNGINGVGAYLCNSLPKWYRPHNDCKMNMDVRSPFCEVCASELTRKFAEITKEEFYGYRESFNINLDGSYDIISKPFSEKIISDHAKRIVDYAFFGRNDLLNFTIPDSVTRIGRYSFLRCTGLTDLFIPESVAYIDDTAFFGCKNLKIYGYAGSCAGAYALKNDVPFVELPIANNVLLLHKFILNVPVPVETANADLNNDKVTDVFDIVSARQRLN